MAKKVLIVDDNQDNRDLIRKILKSTGYELYEATDGQRAIDMAVALKPDLILMDMQLPVLNGYQAVEKIRETPGLRRTTIIGLTSYAMVGDREKVMACGCNEYMAKPLVVATFRQMVKDSLEGTGG